MWKNAAPTAIKLHIDYLRVVISGDRTVVDDQSSTRDATLSRDCEMTGFHPAFSKRQVEDLPTKASGIVEYQVRYGHPEKGFVRLATARLNITFRLDTGTCISIIDTMNDEGLVV